MHERSGTVPSSPIAVLVVSPHVDDEALGCHAFLAPGCHVLYLGVEDRPYVSRRERLAEAGRNSERAGFAWEALDHPVNAYRAEALIPDIERAIERLRPATLLLPQPSYNQDHRAAYDAGIAAARPHDKNWFVPRVLIYEQPDSVLFPHGGEMQPAFFRPIDAEEKVRAYALYASQVRGHRSPDLVRALARLRGAQAGTEWAEGYAVKRMVEK